LVSRTAREKLGQEYVTISKQRRNIMQNILRQAGGDMQLRTPFHLVDLHPEVNAADQQSVEQLVRIET